MCKCCDSSSLRLPPDVALLHITTGAELEAYAENLLFSQTVLALDVEWRPGAADPALLQVACEESVALIDLLALRHCVQAPAILQNLLTREHIARLGWRFDTDLRVLATWMPCLDSVNGYVEIADITLPTLDSAEAGEGLADAVKRSLGLRLCKRAQCSNWEARPLSEEQVHYAALDAYALLMLMEQALQVPDHRALKLGDRKKCRATTSVSRVHGLGMMKEQERHMPRPSRSLARNPEKRMAFITRFCVRAQVYSNCQILSASGILVAHCDRSKAEWYIAKNIARRVGVGEPLAVQLSFCPEKRDGEFDELASKHPRVNRCVVCGVDGNLSRFHLIPKSYQRYFDVRLKAHQCHDIVLLCVDCHEVSNRKVMALKIEIALELNAPLKGLGRSVPSMEERNVVKAASALLRGVERVPPARVAELQAIVTEWLERHGGSEAVLERGSEDGTIDRNRLMYAVRLGKELPRRGGWQAAIVQSDEFQSHGEIVVDTIIKSGGFDGLHEFMIRWREHFVRTMAPRYMPDDWRMEYRVPLRMLGSASQDMQHHVNTSLNVVRC
jgi:exonuclease 3'-5' domain-containing protein 2